MSNERDVAGVLNFERDSFQADLIDAIHSFVDALVNGDFQFRLRSLKAARVESVTTHALIPKNVSGAIKFDIDYVVAKRFFLFFVRRKTRSASITTRVDLQPESVLQARDISSLAEKAVVGKVGLRYQRLSYFTILNGNSPKIIAHIDKSDDVLSLETDDSIRFNGKRLQMITDSQRLGALRFLNTHADTLREDRWSAPIEIASRALDATAPNNRFGVDRIIDALHQRFPTHIRIPTFDDEVEGNVFLRQYLPRQYRLPTLNIGLKSWVNRDGFLLLPGEAETEDVEEAVFQIEIEAAKRAVVPEALSLRIYPSAFHVEGPFHERLIRELNDNRDRIWKRIDGFYVDWKKNKPGLPHLFGEFRSHKRKEMFLDTLRNLNDDANLFVCRVSKKNEAIINIRQATERLELTFYARFTDNESLGNDLTESIRLLSYFSVESERTVIVNEAPNLDFLKREVRKYIASWLRAQRTWAMRETS